MNVFVLCTGRCGSKTFSKACGEIKNYSTGFESRTQFYGTNRLDYKDNHIEVDNRLSWFLGRLDEKYGKNAFYVHLKRNDEDVAKSYVRRYNQGIMKAYRGKGILLGVKDKALPMEIALDYCHTVNTNIDMFLKDKLNKMIIFTEHMKEGFEIFCKLINADVDIDTANAHLQRKYNASK